MQDTNAIPNLADMPPLFTWQDARSVEAGDRKRGQVRRALLAVGSKSGTDLLDLARTATDEQHGVLLDLFESAEGLLEWHKYEAEVLNECFARLILTLDAIETSLNGGACHV